MASISKENCHKFRCLETLTNFCQQRKVSLSGLSWHSACGILWAEGGDGGVSHKSLKEKEGKLWMWQNPGTRQLWTGLQSLLRHSSHVRLATRALHPNICALFTPCPFLFQVFVPEGVVGKLYPPLPKEVCRSGFLKIKTWKERRAGERPPILLMFYHLWKNKCHHIVSPIQVRRWQIREVLLNGWREKGSGGQTRGPPAAVANLLFHSDVYTTSCFSHTDLWNAELKREGKNDNNQKI